jgi:uncharacterized integral membrane protein (TIGR00701 family)
MYEWIKALHVIAVIAWMAGMLYLPRLFVYHCEAEAGSKQSETFKLMERRLLKAIINPAMIVTWLAGLYLAWAGHWFSAPWLHVKLLLVVVLSGVHRLFCKNERAVIQTRLEGGETLTLVPVAAILVASIRLHFLNIVLNAATRGPKVFPCDIAVRKGDELGWFEHGSTIIVLAPDHFEFCENVVESARIYAGQPLMQKSACVPSVSKPG